MAVVDVKAGIKEAEQVLTEKEQIQAKVVALRTLLRNAVAIGDATPEQAAWIEEAFPIRERNTEGKNGDASAQK